MNMNAMRPLLQDEHAGSEPHTHTYKSKYHHSDPCFKTHHEVTDASGAGLGPFSPAAYTLMSKSSLCVAMGTMATLTKRRAKRSARERKTQGGEEKKGDGVEMKEKLAWIQEMKTEKKEWGSDVLIHLLPHNVSFLKR